jgi:lipopolysaccharide export system permease protein
MQSAGMGLLRQIRPLLPVLAVIAVLDYGNQNYLHRMLQPQEQGTAGGQNHQWALHLDQIVYARGTQPQQSRVVDALTFQWASGPFRLERLERARHVERRPEGAWLLHDVVTRRHDAYGWMLEQRPSLERPREQFPDLFQQDLFDAHHTPFSGLSQKIRQLESLGRRVELYHLEWYQKAAALFAPFALVWFGTPLSQVFFRRGRASGEIMIGILGGLLFLIATEILFTLGRGGFLPPLLAAWSVNGVFVGLGSLLVWRLR